MEKKKNLLIIIGVILLIAVIIIIISGGRNRDDQSDQAVNTYSSPTAGTFSDQEIDNFKPPEVSTSVGITGADNSDQALSETNQAAPDDQDSSETGDQYVVHEDGTREVLHPDGSKDIYKPISSVDVPNRNDDWSEEYTALVEEQTELMIGSEWRGSFDEYDREGTFWILALSEDGTFTHFNAESNNTISGTYELIFAEYSENITEPILRLTIDDENIIDYTFNIYNRNGELRLDLDDDPSTPYGKEDILTTPINYHPTYHLKIIES